MIYAFNFIAISIFSYLFDFSNRYLYLKKFLFFVCAFYLCLFAGLRGVGVGADDSAYVNFFESIENYIDLTVPEYSYKISDGNMEHGFAVIASVVSTFTDNHIYFFIVIAALSISINTYVINRLSKMIFISMAAYYVNMYFQKDLNQIRAGLASALVFLQFYYIFQKKLYSAAFAFLLAISIHFSAIVAFVLFFINRPFPKSLCFSALISSVVISFFGLSGFLLELLPAGNGLYEKIAIYINWDLYNYRISITDPVNLKNIFLSLCFMWLSRKAFYHPEYYFVFNTFLFMTCARLALSDLAILSARLSAIFSFSEVLIIPLVILFIKNKIFCQAVIIAYLAAVLSLTLLDPKWSSLFFYHVSFL